MRRSFAILGLVLAVGLISQVASAGVLVAPTNLTIHVKGDTVSGKLAGPPKCRPDQQIELWIDGALVDTTFTDAAGNYSFTRSLTPGSHVQTKFRGSHTGEHPNRTDCQPSRSRVVTVGGHDTDASASQFLVLVARHESLGL